MFRLFLSTILTASFIVLLAGNALAAPQILAVLSTGNGAVMECDDAVCTASLSTYCLQRDRASPPYGTLYHAADTSRYTLVLDFADGREEALAVDERLRFRSTRDYNAVNASIPRTLVDERQAVGVRLMIAEQASLIPDAIAGDPDPLTEQEIAAATGPMRQMAAHIVDDGPGARSIRVLGTMLRGVPEWRGWAQMEKQELLARVNSLAVQERLTMENRDFLEREFAKCSSLLDEGRTYSVGYCLMERHDDALLDLNKKYWETQAGS